jgi:hypothetical protein
MKSFFYKYNLRVDAGAHINSTFEKFQCLQNETIKGEITEPVFLNVYGAQESIPRNEFRQPM